MRTADGSAPSAPRWKGDPRAPGPDLELLGRGRPERVGGAQQGRAALRLPGRGQLADGRGLPHAVDAHHEHDPRPGRERAHRRRPRQDACGSRRAAARAWPPRRPSRSARSGRAAPPSPACVAGRPRSAAMSASSIASRSSGLSGRRPRTRSSTSAFRMSRVRSSPFRNRSRNGSAHHSSWFSCLLACAPSGGCASATRPSAGHQSEHEVVAVLQRPQDDDAPGVPAQHVADAAPPSWRAAMRRARRRARCPGRRRSAGGARRARPPAITTSPSPSRSSARVGAGHGADQLVEDALVGQSALHVSLAGPYFEGSCFEQLLRAAAGGRPRPTGSFLRASSSRVRASAKRPTR